MTEQEFQAQALALAQGVLNSVAAQALPQRVQICALLMALETMATSHACCTELAGQDLIQAGTRLMARAQQRGAQTIH